MATFFNVRTTKTKGFVTLYVRFQSRIHKLNYRAATPYEVDIVEWNKAKKSPTYWSKYLAQNPKLATYMEDLKKELDATLNRETGISPEEFTQILDLVAYREIREKEKKDKEEAAAAEELAKRITLNKFIDLFIEQISNGGRQTDKGTNYAPATIKAVKASMQQFKNFQEDTKVTYNWEDIDLQFYYAYTAWMKKKEYSINTIGKCVKQLKAILATAESEGLHSNAKYKDKKFKGTRVEVDTIYLTKEDLAKIQKTDLTKMSLGHTWARDIFMVGVWTAQRVSDYNNISRDDIQSYQMRSIVDEPDPQNPGKTIARIVTSDVTVINIRQKKTGAKVTVPCSPDLKRILEKYDYQLPHLEDQVINKYIKEIAKKAKLTETVEIEETKGGTPKMVKYKKWELIHTHTARRTGATLMYLSGMDIYDIMKITGHSSPAMLKKYIKADQLEVVDKIMNKYDYFK